MDVSFSSTNSIHSCTIYDFHPIVSNPQACAKNSAYTNRENAYSTKYMDILSKDQLSDTNKFNTNNI